MVFCFFSVGFIFRVRSRKFFVVINCISIDWFYEWLEDVLNLVLVRFLEEVEFLVVSVNIMDFFLVSVDFY